MTAPLTRKTGASRSVLAAVLPLLALSLCLAHAGECGRVKTPCGTILDGLTNGRFDLEFQQSTSTVAANWYGFSDVLQYEWAVFSSPRLASHLPSLQSSSSSQGGEKGVKCVKEMRIAPDVKAWTNVGKDTSAIDPNVHLSVGENYIVALRVTYRSGHQVFSLSNGFTVVASSASSSAPDFFHHGERAERSEEAGESFMLTRDEPTRRTKRAEVPGGDFCPIDSANRCRQSQQSVGDILEERYGPAQFIDPAIFFINPLDGVEEEDTSTTNDDDDGDWIAGIVIGALFLLLLLCLLLALLAVFLLAPKREREEQEPRRKERDQDYGDVGPLGGDLDNKDYGGRAGVATGDASSNYRIEFPDTQIRRLSLTHQDAPDLGGDEAARSPRRKHPIMSSTSSSFRDYRAVGNN